MLRTVAATVAKKKTTLHTCGGQCRSVVNFALIGPPGSGKGTYGSLASFHLQMTFLSAGDLLRNEVEQSKKTSDKGTSNVGNLIAEHQNSGKLVDCHLVGQVVLQSLSRRHTPNGDTCSTKETRPKVPSSRGFVLDGFPRTVKQAELITPKLSSASYATTTSIKEEPSAPSSHWPEHLRVHYAVTIDVPDKVCIDKIMGRRKCLLCNKGFNLSDVNAKDHEGFVMPPILPDTIPCHREGCDPQRHWFTRTDDTEAETVATRLQEFRDETEPVISYYEEQGRLLRFVPYQGLKDINDFFSLLQKAHKR